MARVVAQTELPYPPDELRRRVGQPGDVPSYDQVGKECRDQLLAALPADWSFSGRRVLDFGCGAGRTLRHFADEAGEAEFWGCDVDDASIAWLREHAGDRFTLRRVSDAPGLDAPDGHFDLVYAFSVFTHLSEHWAGWMLELHRVMRDDGLMLATFLGPEFAAELAGEHLEEDHVGMLVLGAGRPWDEGGPCTVVSRWWLEAHWGRAFDVLGLEPGGWVDGRARQGTALLRKRKVDLCARDLERPEPGEPREPIALQVAQNVMIRDTARIAASQAERIRELSTSIEELSASREVVYSSRSWRLTAPLRGFAARARRRR
ncbi:MAG: hypothetical protein DLM64_13955 [Solirubrobacterales bacterium]|nr:MAG: hypothetical protein DLM64_13955 [Solirubrobacterales bacterium]